MTHEKSWRVTGPKGRLVLFGVMPHDRQFSVNTLPLHCYGKTLTGGDDRDSVRPAHRPEDAKA
ncbi:MAG: hypothetical protein ACYDH9_25415 [Limisphaerales bacterium]